MALLVRAETDSRAEPFCERRLHRPPERIDRAHGEDRRSAVPSAHPRALCGRIRRDAARRSTRYRFRVRVGMPSLLEHGLRFLVARDDQRAAAIVRAHFFEHRVHRAGFARRSRSKVYFRPRRCRARRSIMVVSAFANLLLNIEPSHAITPWCLRTSRNRNGGKISGRCTWRASPK